MGNYFKRPPTLAIPVTESAVTTDVSRDSIHSPNVAIRVPSIRVQKIFTFDDILPETPITYVCRTSITQPVIKTSVITNPVISDSVITSEKNIVDIIEALRIDPEESTMDIGSSTDTLHKPTTPNNSLQNSPQNSPRDVLDHTSFYHAMKALTL